MEYQYQAPKSHQDFGSKYYQTNQHSSHQKVHYPPKSGILNQVSYGYERFSMQNSVKNWNHNQPVLQFQQGTCHLKNSSESDSKNQISLRKII
jgi:hypothetical protein